MATRFPRTIPQVTTIATAFNALKAQIGAASFFHLDKSEFVVEAADGDGTLSKAVALANNVMQAYLFHLADTLAHKVVDDPPALVAATDLTTAQTLANAIKADYNVHRASTTFHYTADATNVIAAADATNQASLDTLLNEIKTDFNLHMASGQPAASLRVVEP
jgi:hypothetical protein